MIKRMVITTTEVWSRVTVTFPDCHIARLRPLHGRFAWHALISDLAGMFSEVCQEGVMEFGNLRATILNPRVDLSVPVSTVQQFAARRGKAFHDLSPVRWMGHPLTGASFSNLYGGPMAAFMATGPNAELVRRVLQNNCGEALYEELVAPIFALERVDCLGVLAKYQSPTFLWGIQWADTDGIIQKSAFVLNAAVHVAALMPGMTAELTGSIATRYREYVYSMLPPGTCDAYIATMFIESPEFGIAIPELVQFIRKIHNFQWILVTDRQVPESEDVVLNIERWGERQ